MKVSKRKYTCTCDHCGKETSIGFEEWNNLNTVMLSFLELSQEQKDMILLMIDGAMYRANRRAEAKIDNVNRKDLQE